MRTHSFSICLLPLAISSLFGQEREIWKSGNWSLYAPSGRCESIPALTVKGAGSIFDSQNASALTALQAGLPTALEASCPGVREVILVSGRVRRLTKVAGVVKEATAADAPRPVLRQGDVPPMVSSASPRPTPQQADVPVVIPAAAGTRVTSVPTQAREVSSPSSAPVLSPRSDLPSLSSARGDEGRCEVLLKWLESGKADSVNSFNEYAPPPTMRAIFRDERMSAVFGKPYDQTENKWRLEQYDKVIADCLGVTKPASRGRPIAVNIPFGGSRGPNREMQQYHRQFSQYRRLLDQAFLAQPGQFEPSALNAYVGKVREQLAWSNQTMITASAAQPNEAAFTQIAQQLQDLENRSSTLTDSERVATREYLRRRQREMAPVIVENWLREKGGMDRTLTAARSLYAAHETLVPILGMMDSAPRSDWERRYSELIESALAGPLRTDLDGLAKVPESLVGVMQLAGLRQGFESNFGEFSGVQSILSARDRYQQARTGLLTKLLPAWRTSVERLPLEAPALAAKHQEFVSLFPNREDQAGALFNQYEAPLSSKEDQLRTLIAAAASRREDTASSPQANPGGSPTNAGRAVTLGGHRRPTADGPLTMNDFKSSGLVNQGLVSKLFNGDFTNIEVDREDLLFNGLFNQYLDAFGTSCKEWLPDHPAPIMVTECQAWDVWRNGYGVETRRSCSNWVTRPTGIYADPALYDAIKAVDRQKALDAGREISKTMQTFTGPNGISNAMGLVGTAQAVISDARSIVELNGCASPGLKRFEDNLRMFALNKQPIGLDGKPVVSLALVSIPGIPFKDHDYTKLIADLVADDAQKWGAFAKFAHGSITTSSVSSRDKDGRPARVTASYAYQDLMGNKRGTVSLTFDEGMPKCLTYSETPAVCHAPDRKIVQGYLRGNYR